MKASVKGRAVSVGIMFLIVFEVAFHSIIGEAQSLNANYYLSQSNKQMTAAASMSAETRKPLLTRELKRLRIEELMDIEIDLPPRIDQNRTEASPALIINVARQIEGRDCNGLNGWLQHITFILSNHNLKMKKEANGAVFLIAVE